MSTGVVQGRQRVLVISLSDLTMDARIRRQVQFLSSSYEVVVAAVGRSLPGVEFHELSATAREPGAGALERAARLALRRAGRYERAYWQDARTRRWFRELRDIATIDAIIVNDLWAVPLALSISGSAPVIFDSHEHWTSESASWTVWNRLSMHRAHEWIVDNAVPRTAGVMTVSRGIATDYERRLGTRPTLVTNAPFYHALAPSAVHDPIRLLHIGLPDPRRRLEDTIAAVRLLGTGFTLDLVLARENAYRRRLERLVAGEQHIRILPGVPTEELVSFANSYDVGVFLLPADFPNQVQVLPNKMFDYIQARLAVAIGPSPEMAAVVREWDCGIVAEDFSPRSFARALERLTVPEVERMKCNSDRAATVLSAETNLESVLELVRGAIESSASAPGPVSS
jgi:glycosyltransferase involved in cell wall biosynthesis